MSSRVSVLLVAGVVVLGLSACGGDDDGDEPGTGADVVTEYADGVCVDRAQPGAIPTDPSAESFPQIVDCGSPEAQGTLKAVDDYETDCDPGQGFESFSVAKEGETESGGSFCIEPTG